MANANSPQAAFVAVDLETTGLDVDRCSILEIGVVVADADLNVINSCSSLVAPLSDLSEMDDFVREMHQGNGLLSDLERCNLLNGPSAPGYAEWTPSAVAKDVRYWLEHVCGLHAKQLPLTGSSVAFDRLFMQRHMPELEEFFHYRNVDISTVKELAKVWAPDVKWEPSKDKLHRPVDDLLATLEEAAFYKDSFFT